MFIAVGTSNATNFSIAAYSTDGKSWYSLNSSIISVSLSTQWQSIAWSSVLRLWATVGTYGPVNGAYIFIPTSFNNGSLLLPSGNVLFSPVGSSNVMEYQPGGYEVRSNIFIGPDLFNGLVLAPNGKVVTVPSGQSICVIDLVGRTSTTVGPIAGSGVTNLFKGGALLPSGNIVFVPGTSGNVGMFDPVALTYSNSTSTGTSGIAFSGATLLPSGQVVFTPSDSANVGILDTFTSASTDFCLSPYFNKF
jgi:hypothetical protein